MKYHVMYTLEHGFAIEALNIKEAEQRALAAIKNMSEPTARLLSVIVDGYVPRLEAPKPVVEVATKESVLANGLRARLDFLLTPRDPSPPA